jgi:hypothetical protein
VEELPVMAEFDRKELERKLAKVLSKDLRAELKKLLDMLGDPPDLTRVPDLYWQTGWKLIAKHVEPYLVEFFIQQALEALNGIGVSMDLAVINTNAVEWAANNSDKWLKEAFGHTYEGVSVLVPKAYEEGWTTAELAKALERYYSPVRAEMIAVTELTRAQVEGEKAVERWYFETYGSHLVPIWKTANDDKVCLICNPQPPDLPRNEMPITDDFYPPAHPRCRCRLSYLPENRLNPVQRARWQSR